MGLCTNPLRICAIGWGMTSQAEGSDTLRRCKEATVRVAGGTVCVKLWTVVTCCFLHGVKGLKDFKDRGLKAPQESSEVTSGVSFQLLGNRSPNSGSIPSQVLSSLKADPS